MTMTAYDLHQQHETAMDFATEALVAVRDGDEARAQALFRQAYALEAELVAAPVIGDDLTRVILLRSAANLALEAEQPAAAAQLLAQADALNPPASLAAELRVLHERIQLRHHLATEGLMLRPNELHFVLAGPAIEHGVAPSEVVLPRLSDLERLLLRTAEQMLALPFRKRGAPLPTVQEHYGLYLAAPRAGSFAVTLGLGHPSAVSPLDPEPHPTPAAVLARVLDGLRLIQFGKHHHLRALLGDSDYYRDFVTHARSLAPDQKQVTLVGLATWGASGERIVELTRPRHAVDTSDLNDDDDAPTVQLIGRLEMAHEGRGKRSITLYNEAEDATYTIHVPHQNGKLTHIVREFWGQLVLVQAHRPSRHRLELLEIAAAPTPTPTTR